MFYFIKYKISYFIKLNILKIKYIKLDILD